MFVTGFMCKTDYDYHLDHDSYGATVFPSIEDLKSHRRCVTECGIVEVKIELVRVVQEENFNDEECDVQS